MQFGMPTLIETPKLEDCAKLCRDLGLEFIELNNNFPWYQLDTIDPEAFWILPERELSNCWKAMYLG